MLVKPAHIRFLLSEVRDDSSSPVLWAGAPSAANANVQVATTNTKYTLVVGILGIVCLIVLVFIYYKFFSKYCTDCDVGLRRNRSRVQFRENFLVHDLEAWRGLSESAIRIIPVFDFKEKTAHFQGKDCAVCLSAFDESDKLRVLPNCGHGFHLPCIDLWLQSHANCPLCRANIMEGRFIPAMAPRMSAATLDV